MITERMLVEEVCKVINENPGYVYSNDTCSYLKCNEACVFGVVLSNLGFTQDELSLCEKPKYFYNTRISAVFYFKAYEGKFIDISHSVINWCARIQSSQDGKMPWVECLRIANEGYPEVLEKYPESYPES